MPPTNTASSQGLEDLCQAPLSEPPPHDESLYTRPPQQTSIAQVLLLRSSVTNEIIRDVGLDTLMGSSDALLDRPPGALGGFQHQEPQGVV